MEKGEHMRQTVLAVLLIAAGAGQAYAQDAAAGDKAFVVCKACHQVGDSAKNAVGPVPVARSMPQLGLLYILVAVPMNVLSGNATPLESMPRWLAIAMQASPSTHFVSFAQSILYRGAGLDVVWPQFLAVAGIAALFLVLSLIRFRSALGSASP
jgi:hypothetical protein